MLSPAQGIYLGIITDALNLSADEVAERMGVRSVIFTCDNDTGKINVWADDFGVSREFSLKMKIPE